MQNISFLKMISRYKRVVIVIFSRNSSKDQFQKYPK